MLHCMCVYDVCKHVFLCEVIHMPQCVCVCVMFTHMYFCVRPYTCHMCVAVRQRTTLNGEGSFICPCAICSNCSALVSQ